MKKDSVSLRLKRVIGQVKAVEKMYDERRSCYEIVQQIQAARSALSGVSTNILRNEAVRCVKNGKVKELEKIVDRTFKTIN